MPRISQLRKDERRQQILDAALALFARDGFHQTGMAEIVAACGMSRGAVYGYFDSKDEIIEALADDRHAREARLNVVATLWEDPLEALHALLREYALWFAEEQGEARRRVGVHGWAEALRNPRVRARVVEGARTPMRLIAGLVRKAQASGALDRDIDADAVARALVALFQGFVLQKAWGEDIDADACLAIADRMLGGLRAPNLNGGKR